MFLRSRRRGGRLPGLGLGMSVPANLRLSGDGLLGSLTGADVGINTLAVDRQPATITNTLIKTDLHLTLKILNDISTQVALHLEVGVHPQPQTTNLLVSKIPNPDIANDPNNLANVINNSPTHTININKKNLQPLLPKN